MSDRWGMVGACDNGLQGIEEGMKKDWGVGQVDKEKKR